MCQLSSVRPLAFWEAFQWRSTSRSSDETIIIASLLNLSTYQILKSPAEEGRMQILLSLLDDQKKIPSGFIFLPGPRISDRGFGWAPKSWMTRHGRDYPDPQFPKDRMTLYSSLTPDGLIVQYPGIRLRRPVEPMLEERFWVTVSRSLHEWYSIEYIRDSDTADWTDICRQQHPDLGLIYSRPNPGEISEIALLVSIQGERIIRDTNAMAQDGNSGIAHHVISAKILCRAWVRLETNNTTTGALRAEFRQDPNGALWGETLGREQRWCVD
jgi:hypothetical protein